MVWRSTEKPMTSSGIEPATFRLVAVNVPISAEEDVSVRRFIKR
jgi:hypothetical protein